MSAVVKRTAKTPKLIPPELAALRNRRGKLRQLIRYHSNREEELAKKAEEKEVRRLEMEARRIAESKEKLVVYLQELEQVLIGIAKYTSVAVEKSELEPAVVAEEQLSSHEVPSLDEDL